MGIAVVAEVKVSGQTGVEMEALTAVSVACLTIYDMLKAADKGMIIRDVRLVERSAARAATGRRERYLFRRFIISPDSGHAQEQAHLACAGNGRRAMYETAAA